MYRVAPLLWLLSPRPSFACHSLPPFTMAFENVSTSVAASRMRNALSALGDSVTDPKEKKRFEAEMDNFFALFRRFFNDRANGTAVDWCRIAPPPPPPPTSLPRLLATTSLGPTPQSSS
ncbi:unnamed protein product [Penicillium nalgiovense]|nr:unnamed protein product [Penicillium nalgiovense]